MPAQRFLPRVLLVQVRRSIEAIRHERVCFERLTDGMAQLEFHNMVDEPGLDWVRVQPFEVLLLGGSGECSATEEYEFSEALALVVRRWTDESRPFFGSCWGHHFLASTLGGTVVTDSETSEVGTFRVELSANGLRDSLFGSLPRRFQAQMGHHDYVAELPEGAESLASSARCPNQAIKLKGKPVYSTQFHSEMGRREILERLRMYREGYLEGATLEDMKERIGPSPAVKPLVSRFLKLHT